MSHFLVIFSEIAHQSYLEHIHQTDPQFEQLGRHNAHTSVGHAVSHSPQTKWMHFLRLPTHKPSHKIPWNSFVNSESSDHVYTLNMVWNFPGSWPDRIGRDLYIKCTIRFPFKLQIPWENLGICIQNDKTGASMIHDHHLLNSSKHRFTVLVSNRP